MISVNDIAEYLSMNFISITQYKLHTLLFYSEIWHIMLTNNILFKSEFVKKNNGIFIKGFNYDLNDTCLVRNINHDSHLERIGNIEFSLLNDIISVYGDFSDSDLSFLIKNEIAYQKLDNGSLMNAENIHMLYSIT